MSIESGFKAHVSKYWKCEKGQEDCHCLAAQQHAYEDALAEARKVVSACIDDHKNGMESLMMFVRRPADSWPNFVEDYR